MSVCNSRVVGSRTPLLEKSLNFSWRSYKTLYNGNHQEQFEGFTMMHVFNKNQSRWVMKRAHELAKCYFEQGTYNERFAKALKMAHAEAAKILNNYNWLLQRFAGHDRCYGAVSSMGRDLHDRLMAIDVFAYNGLKPLSILGCFQQLFDSLAHAYKSWAEFGEGYLRGLANDVKNVIKMRDFYYEPNGYLERQAFYRSKYFF